MLYLLSDVLKTLAPLQGRAPPDRLRIDENRDRVEAVCWCQVCDDVAVRPLPVIEWARALRVAERVFDVELVMMALPFCRCGLEPEDWRRLWF